jgi:hypothetical protein
MRQRQLGLGPFRLAKMSVPVCIMGPKAGQPQWMMEATE